MSWWWDSYLATHDLGYHYAALARFLRGQPLPGAEWSLVRSSPDPAVRVLGLKSRSAALLWVQHPDNRWYRRLVEQRGPAPLKRVSINLGGLDRGRYRVEWWDTYAGQPTTHTTLNTRDGQVILRVPPGHPDIACKVRREAD
jgi:hypothetical protein